MNLRDIEASRKKSGELEGKVSYIDKDGNIVFAESVGGGDLPTPPAQSKPTSNQPSTTTTAPKPADQGNPNWDESQHPRGPDGRFGGGPSAAPADAGKAAGAVSDAFANFDKSLKDVALIAEAKNGKTVKDKAGVACKAIYEGTTDDGQKIRLYDKVGGLKPEEVKAMLQSVATLTKEYGNLKPTRSIIVEHNGTKDKSEYAHVDSPPKKGLSGLLQKLNPNAYKGGNPSFIHVNADKMLGDSNFNQHIASEGASGWQMPAAKKASNFSTGGMEYVMAHEFGHTFSFQNNRGAASKALFNDPRVKSELSKYGHSNADEGYAEAFADWHVSKGTTTNKASQAYAAHEGWVANKVKPSAPAPAPKPSTSTTTSKSSSTTKRPSQTLAINMLGVDPNIEFAVGNATSDQLPPEPFSEGVKDFFDGKNYAENNFVTPEPTDAEIAKAKAVIDKVFGGQHG